MLRRAYLVLALSSAVAVPLACGSVDDAANVTPDGGPAAVPTGTTAPDDAATPVDATAPATGYPIKHVVVVVKENHTFDNYFGSFPGAEGTTTCTKSDGSTFPCPHAPDKTSHDLSHVHSAGLVDYNGGKMDGWDLPGSSSAGDDLAYAQYTEQDIPNYWQYARRFTLADHFYSEMIGPSFPGHLAVLAAQAAWTTGNPNGVQFVSPVPSGSWWTIIPDRPD